MKLSLTMPKWLQPASAPLPDQQLQLTEARAALERADEDLERARRAYDAAVTPETSATFVAAEAARAEAERYLDRAERLVAAAERKAAEDERAELQARCDELEARTSLAAIAERHAPLAAREAEAIIALVEVRAARRAVERDIFADEGERDRLRDQLGLAEHRTSQRPPQGPSTPVIEALHAWGARLPRGDVRLDLASEIIADLAPGRRMHVGAPSTSSRAPAVAE